MNGEVEYRFAAFELRAADEGPGVIQGIAMVYGREAVIAPGLRERFEPGAFGDVGSLDVRANMQHDRRAPLARSLPGGGLVLADGPSELRAEVSLPDTQTGRDVAVLARRGVLSGFSIEFRVRPAGERVEAGTRVISRADLVGLAVVDVGAYPNAVITALRARIEGIEGAPARRRPWL